MSLHFCGADRYEQGCLQTKAKSPITRIVLLQYTSPSCNWSFPLVKFNVVSLIYRWRALQRFLQNPTWREPLFASLQTLWLSNEINFALLHFK